MCTIIWRKSLILRLLINQIKITKWYAKLLLKALKKKTQQWVKIEILRLAPNHKINLNGLMKNIICSLKEYENMESQMLKLLISSRQRPNYKLDLTYSVSRNSSKYI